MLTSEDETLLVGRDALLVLDLLLHVLDRVGRLDLERDRLAGQSLHEDLHATTETKDKMECRLLLNVVVGERAPVLELLAGENEALLVRGNALLVLDLLLHVLNGVGRLDLINKG